MAKHRTFRMEAPRGNVPPSEIQDTIRARPEFCVRRPVRPGNRHKTPADPNASTPTCYDCVYALWDRSQWLSTLSSGWPVRPTCANHPDSLGVMTEIPYDGTCRKFRWKREPRRRMAPPKPSSPDIAYISLSRGKFAIVDKADFERLNKYKWFLMDGSRGKKACAARNEKRRTITMHRQIMQPPPGMFVDHINHNRKDNRRCNLRNCTPPQNVRNRRVCGSKSGFIGVYAHGRKWKVVVTCNGKRYRLCGFTDKIEAALARDRLARKLFGEFAYLNFPDRQPQTPPTPPPDQPQPKSAPIS